MNPSDSDPKPEETALPSPSPDARTAISRARLNRPPSIGDASQLFGGSGGGPDDFFGHSSISSGSTSNHPASLFDPVPEEIEPAGSSFPDNNDPFAWPTTDQSTLQSNPHPALSANVPPQTLESLQPHPTPAHYEPPAIPPSNHYHNPYQPITHNYTHHDHQATTITHPQIYPSSHPNSDHYNPPRLTPPVTSYAQPDQRNSSGLLRSSLHTTGFEQQQPQQQNLSDYNPYIPTDPYASQQNPYAPHLPQKDPLSSSTTPYLSDLIPRSASVNALSSSDLVGQRPPYSPLQRPKLIQSPTNQTASSPLNRPKIYDAYDPPAIRKKKPHAFNAPASLPASPAIGGAGFNPQTSPFAASSASPTRASPIVPPPPPKQRCISTPAQTYPSAQPTSVAPNDFYAHPSHLYDHQKQFVPSTYPNASIPPPPANQPIAFNADPYHPNSSTNYTPPPPPPPPSQPISNLNNTSDGYQNLPRPPQAFNYGSPDASISQPSTNPYLSISQSEDPYAVDSPQTKDDHAISASSPPVPLERVQSNLAFPYDANGKTSPLGQAFGSYETIQNSYLNDAGLLDHSQSKVASARSSTLTPSSDEGVNVRQPAGPSHSTPERYSSEATPQDPIDALSSAAQKLSLHTEVIDSNRSFPVSMQFNSNPSVQSPSDKLDSASSANPANSFETPQKFMSVPDVQIQPATPQIPKIEPTKIAVTSQFDVLADLTSLDHTEKPNLDSPTIQKDSLDHFDYEAPNHSTSQYSYGLSYSTEYDYQPTHPNNGYVNQHPDSSHLPSSSDQSPDHLQSYDPYNPSLDPNNNGVAAPNLDGYVNDSHSSSFVPFNQQDPYRQSSDYNPTSGKSDYGNSLIASQPLHDGLQPESLISEPTLTSHYDTPAQWNQATNVDELPKDSGVYNPYEPVPQQLHQDLANPHRTEDPLLERLKYGVPIASFGFGGKLITIFPDSTSGATVNPVPSGYANPYNSGGMFPSGADTIGRTVKIQQLSDVIPSTDLHNFPGPLFMDGGSSGKSSLGKKRQEVVNWLESKLDESEKELVFLQSTLVAGRTQNETDPNRKDFSHVHHAQDKIILLKLLKVLVENEGKLSGTSKVDEAVRLILQSFSGSPPTLETPSTLLTHTHGPNSVDSNKVQDILTTYTTRSSHLDSIQIFLSNGDRQKAIQVAIEHKMWPHALIIANSVGNDAWRETVKEFVRFELNCDGADHSNSNSILASGPPSTGRESLRTLYTLFAGAGPAAVDEFLVSSTVPSPSSTYSESHGVANMVTGISNGQLGTSRVASPAPLLHQARPSNTKIPDNVLQQWRSVVAMTVANRVPGSSPFLLRLGDTLLSNGRIYAAHVTYLLSNGLMPQLCLENGNRISLLGSPVVSSPDRPGLDTEAVMLTEVLEFALSLSPVPKNLDPFIGIPHLQAYRLALGLEYATFGFVDRANKYCEALAGTFKLATKPCHFYHPTLLGQIKALSARLSSTSVADKNTSWITRKMPRPTLDNVWQTLEGRVHKFVAGDDEDSNQAASNSTISMTQNNQILGPFSHFSSISPGSASAAISRVQSSTDLGQINHQSSVGVGLAGPFHHNANFQRPSSGAGYSSSTSSQLPRRGSMSYARDGFNLSPTDYPSSLRGQTSSVPPLNSYEPSTSVTSPANRTSSSVETLTAESITTTTISSGGGGWWEASNSYGTPINSSAGQPVFESIEDTPIADDGSGFIDPMASFGGVPSYTSSGFSMTTQTNYDSSSNSRSSYQPHQEEAEEEEDLGFGNRSSRKRDQDKGDPDEDHPVDDQSSTKTKANHQAEQQASPGTADADNGKTVKPAPSSSWLGRWFKRDANPAPQGSGPVKANLGEDFSLVYDPETKRWVNKKAGSSQTPSSSGPPPPPPRAQTASPTSSTRTPLMPPNPTTSPSSLRNGIITASNAPPPPPAMSRSNTTGYPGSSLDVNPPNFSSPSSSSTKQDDFSKLPSSNFPPPSAASSSTMTSINPLPAPSNSSNNPTKKSTNKKNIRSRYVEIR